MADPVTPARRGALPWILAALALAAVGGVVLSMRGAPPGPAGPSSHATTTATGSAAASAPAAAEKLRVVVLAEGESDLVHLAAARGLFAAEGLDVERVTPKRRGVSLKMLHAGKADVAIAGDAAVAAAAVRREGFTVFAAVARADDQVVVVGRKDKGVAAVADLKGKRVGVDDRVPARYALHRFLDAHGLAPTDLTLVEMKTKQLPGALARGEVAAIADAFASKHPVVQQLDKNPALDVVALSEPSRYHLTLTAVALRDTLQKRPAAIRAFVRALLRAADLAHGERAAASRAVAELTGTELHQVEADWQRLTFDVRLDPALLTALDDEARWFAASGLTDAGGAAPPAASFVDAAALRAERPAAVTLPP